MNAVNTHAQTEQSINQQQLEFLTSLQTCGHISLDRTGLITHIDDYCCQAFDHAKNQIINTPWYNLCSSGKNKWELYLVNLNSTTKPFTHKFSLPKSINALDVMCPIEPVQHIQLIPIFVDEQHLGFKGILVEKHPANPPKTCQPLLLQDIAIDNLYIQLYEFNSHGKLVQIKHPHPILNNLSLDIDKLHVNWLKTLHPNDINLWQSNWNEHVSSKSTTKFTATYRLQNSNHSAYSWVKTNIHPILNQDGNIIGYYGGGVDITEEKEALDQLSQRENILANISTGLFEMDKKGNLIWWKSSNEFKNTLKTLQITGMNWVNNLHPADRENVTKLWLNYCNSNSITPFSITCRTLNKLGSFPTWLKTIIYPNTDDDNIIRNYIGISFDISDEKNTQSKLEILNTKYINLTENLPLGLLEFDKKGNINYANKTMCDMYKVDNKTSFMNYNNIDIVQPKQLHELHIIISPYFKLNALRPFKANHVFAPDVSTSTSTSTSISIYPLFNKDSIHTSYIGISSDLTKTTELEKKNKYRRNQVNKLTKSLLINEIGTGVAHQINQPLTAIQSSAQLLLSNDAKLLKQNTADTIRLLKYITANTKRMGEITHSINNLYRYQLASPTTTNLSELFLELIENFQADNENLKINIELNNKLASTKIEVDKTLLQCMLSNLIQNSIEATDCQAKQVISIDIKASLGIGQNLFISVRDYGLGIPSSIRSLVYEHFFTTKDNGSGIGLAVIKTIINSMSGNVSLKSHRPGVSFTLSIPNIKLVPS